MYVVHIKLLNGERRMEYANDIAELSAKADAYADMFTEFKAFPITTKDIRQGKETKANGNHQGENGQP